MKSATHSEREQFVLQLARAVPHAENKQVQRFLRMAWHYARLQSEGAALRKIVSVQDKIRAIAHIWQVYPVFDHEPYAVRLILQDRTRLDVPTSHTGAGE